MAEGINGSINAHCPSVSDSVRVTLPACQRRPPPIRRHALGVAMMLVQYRRNPAFFRERFETTELPVLD
ncbi:hypothetical protein DEJ37_01725 [Kocuria rosea]|nr:hypothetical protein DEJ37_01725 [Kocuria rosea]